MIGSSYKQKPAIVLKIKKKKNYPQTVTRLDTCYFRLSFFIFRNIYNKIMDLLFS